MTFCISYTVLLEISQDDVNIYNKVLIYGVCFIKFYFFFFLYNKIPIYSVHFMMIIVKSIFLGWQTVIKCNSFIVFLVSLECIKCVFLVQDKDSSSDQERINQVQSKKTSFN